MCVRVSELQERDVVSVSQLLPLAVGQTARQGASAPLRRRSPRAPAACSRGTRRSSAASVANPTPNKVRVLLITCASSPAARIVVHGAAHHGHQQYRLRSLPSRVANNDGIGPPSFASYFPSDVLKLLQARLNTKHDLGV